MQTCVHIHSHASQSSQLEVNGRANHSIIHSSVLVELLLDYACPSHTATFVLLA